MMDNGYDGQGWGMGWGGWLIMSILVVVLLALLVAVIFWLVRGSRGGIDTRPPQPPRELAETTLAERFARGEIDEEEYLRRKAVLDAH
jgi:putative membrane protein